MQKIIRITAISLLILTALNALIAGAMFIYDPTGQLMGMSTEYIKHSPFTTYLIPGIVLFFVNGVLNIYTAYITIKKKTRYPLFIMLQGVLLTGWIVIQVLMVKDISMLHIIMFSIGLILFVLGILLKKIL